MRVRIVIIISSFTYSLGGVACAGSQEQFSSTVDRFVGWCGVCVASTYKNGTGFGACEACPANSNSSRGSDSIANCTCDAGYVEEAGACIIICGAGTYKNGTGLGACEACPANSNSSRGSDSIANCTCDVGYTGEAGVCSDIDECTAGVHNCALVSGLCGFCWGGCSCGAY